MDALVREFRKAYAGERGNDLAKSITPDLSESPAKYISVWESGRNAQAIKDDLQFLFVRDKSAQLRMSREEAQGWQEVYLAYWKALGEILAVEGHRRDGAKSSWTKVYESWKEFTSQILRGYTNHDFENWTIPCLYVAGRYMRLYAIRADAERASNGANDDAVTNFQDDFDPETEKHKSLEDCARQLNRIFNTCLSDRAPLAESRKWGIYYAINLLFKTYFKLNSASLSKHVLRSLSAGRGDMPELDSFPKSQQVTFKYYEGVLAFLEENYVEAEKHLTEAWEMCHRDATRNLELILTYLIPCHLLTTHTLPSAKLLEAFPKLQNLFLKLAVAVKKGDLRAFDQALAEGEDEFVKRRIYLTLERGRDIALRNLLRKVFIAGGFEEAKDGQPPVRRTRVPVAEFAAAMKLNGGQAIDTDEVECLLANMIYKNLMKGYIAHERGIVVLSKNGAFPGTGI
ncbi:PCI domain-containing protein [Seiridium cupressi]|uniref:PCI domain-containing protein n=1 Tax=Seiridium cardinale TaxID=138064 RepID=A0ABR2XP36_9PEZI